MSKIVNLYLENFENFHCPVCGKHLVGYESTEDYCEHVLFIFVDAIGEFVHVHESMQEYADVWHDDEEWDEMEEQDIGIMDLMEKHMPEKTSVLFEIETRGMACGPVTNMDYIGIDFSA